MPEWTKVLQLSTVKKIVCTVVILRENIYMNTPFHALLFVIAICGKYNPLSILLNKMGTGC